MNFLEHTPTSIKGKELLHEEVIKGPGNVPGIYIYIKSNILFHIKNTRGKSRWHSYFLVYPLDPD